MENKIDISSLPIADKVGRYARASYYAALLDSMQSEAWRLGFFFGQEDEGVEMPPALVNFLSYAIGYCHAKYLCPDLPPIRWEERAEEDIFSGWSGILLMDMVAGLTALGLRLQKTIYADGLLELEMDGPTNVANPLDKDSVDPCAYSEAELKELNAMSCILDFPV